jgi:hypothetical protein
MAPLPENTTGRLWVGYGDGQHNHELMVRYAGGATSPTGAMTWAAAFLAALAAELFVLNITEARYAAAASNISIPITWTGASTYGTGAMPAVNAPRQICFQGRSTGGRRVKWYIFGCKLETPNNYWLNRTANTSINDAYDLLAEAQDAGYFLSVDGLNPINYGYITFNFNSYWEQEVRG